MVDCKAIGIDLGTTYCCVAVYRGGKAKVIANDQGHRTTPCYVWFSEDDIYIGEEAKKNCGRHPQQIAYGIKQLIGRKFYDPEVQNYIKNWPFKVTQENGVPKVQVVYKNKVNKFSPEEILAMFLAKMKKTAEDYLEQEVKEAVINVPAYFNDAQRMATIAAGRIAGLKVLRIINETTAAALAYAAEGKLGTSRPIFVFHFGGGTLDVSIIIDNNGTFEVKAVDGDHHLGGEDIDHNLMQYVVEECKRKHNIVLNANERSKLKRKCEDAKISLSTMQAAEITLGGLTDGKSFSMTITRARFDDLNTDLFNKTLEPVKKVLFNAKVDPNDIDHILLVGGSASIPKIRQMMQAFFTRGKLSNGIQPEEAVACGAAVQAAMLKNNLSIAHHHQNLSDALDIESDKISKTNERNNTIPISNSRNYMTADDNQTCIYFKVVESESLVAADNNLLGQFVLCGLPSAGKGVITAHVTLEVDNKGALTISAVEKNTGSAAKFTVTSTKQQISDVETNRMIMEEKQFKLDEENKRQCALIKNELEDYIYDIRKTIEGNLKTKIFIAEKIFVSFLCDDTSKWIAENPNAGKSEIDMKRKTLENAWNMIVEKTNEMDLIMLDDDNDQQRTMAKNKLEHCIYDIQKAVEGNMKTKISFVDKTIVLLQCDDTIKWIAENPKAWKLLFDMKLKMLENVWNPIIEKTKEAEEFKFDDETNRQCALIKHELEFYICDIQSRIKENVIHISIADKTVVSYLCDDTSKWIAENPNAEKLELDMKRKMLENAWTPIAEKIKEAEQLMLDDENQRHAMMKNELEYFIYDIQKAVDGNLKTKISIADKTIISFLCNDTSKWIAENPKTGKLELDMKRKMLENAWNPIAEKASIN